VLKRKREEAIAGAGVRRMDAISTRRRRGEKKESGVFSSKAFDREKRKYDSKGEMLRHTATSHSPLRGDAEKVNLGGSQRMTDPA